MIRIKEYDTVKEWLDDTSMRGFRSLTNSWINFKLHVVWVNGADDPANTPPIMRNMTEKQYIKQIAERDGVKII